MAQRVNYGTTGLPTRKRSYIAKTAQAIYGQIELISIAMAKSSLVSVTKTKSALTSITLTK